MTTRRRVSVRSAVFALLAALAALTSAVAAQTASFKASTTIFNVGPPSFSDEIGAITVTPSGDIYACRLDASTIGTINIIKIAASGAQSTIILGNPLPVSTGLCNSIASDASGNIYLAVGVTSGSGLLVIPAGSTTASVLPVTGVSHPSIEPNAVSVVGGELYVADDAGGSGFNGVLYKVPVGTSGGAATIIYDNGAQNGGAGIVGQEFTTITADAAGDVFAGETSAIATGNTLGVFKCASTCTGTGGAWSTFTSIPGPPAHANVWSDPRQLTVDASGNLYVANYQFKGSGTTPPDTFTEITKVSTPTTTPGYAVADSGTAFYEGVAFDPYGNLFDASNSAAGTGASSITELGTVGVFFRGQNVSSASGTLPLTFNITGTGAFGMPLVLTQGAPSLDFADSSDTCHGSLASGTTCTVNVAFTPSAPGPRLGAVVLVDGGGNRLATAYLYGIGEGAAVTFVPATPSVTTLTTVTGQTTPGGVWAGGAGAVLHADNSAATGTVKNGTTLIATATANSLVDQITVDGAGNTYFAEPGAKDISRVDAKTGVVTHPGGTFASAVTGVAVDGYGDIFIASGAQITEIPASGSPNLTFSSLGGAAPQQLAPDGANDLIVSTSTSPSGLAELVLGSAVQGSGAVTTYASVGTGAVTGVAAEASGGAYSGDTTASGTGISRFAHSGATVQPITTAPRAHALALDGSGNIYYTNAADATVDELALASPPALDFTGTPIAIGSTSAAQTVVVNNIGNATLSLDNLTVSAGFTLAGSSCAFGSQIAPGATCTLVVAYSPRTTAQEGSVSGQLNLTVNTGASGADVVKTLTLSAQGVEQVPTSLAYQSAAGPVYTGGNFGSAVNVRILDANGFLDADETSSVTIAVTGPGSYTSAATAAVAGVATVDLSAFVPTVAGTYTLTASDGALTTAVETVSVVATNVSIANTAVGQNVASTTVTVLLPSGGTVASIAVLVQGQAEPELTNTNGGTCSATTYAAGATCTVTVKFAPFVAGLRKGAVVLYDSSNNPLATVYVSGVGTAALGAFPGTVATVATSGASLTFMSGLATDGSSFYLGTTSNGILLKISSGGAVSDICTGCIPTGTGTASVAVDGAGNLFELSDSSSSRSLLEFVNKNGALATTPVTYATGLNIGLGNTYDLLAIDASGNVDVAEYNAGNIWQYPANGGARVLLASGLGSNTHSISLDPSGNIYFVHAASIERVPAGGGSATVITNATGVRGATAFDAAGNLYTASPGVGITVYSIAGTTATQTAQYASSAFSDGMVLDGSGNIYFGDDNSAQLDKITVSTPPALAFPSTQPDGATSAAQTFAYTNIGNSTLNFGASGVAFTTGTQFALAGSNTCVSGGTVAVADTCTLAATFTPTSAGAKTDTLTLTSDAVNSLSTVSLTGTGLATTLAVGAGNTQTARVSTLFGSALVVNVTTSNGVAQGVPVTLTLPSQTGASATVTVNPVTTDASGNASFTLTANANNGAYTVSASAPDTASTAAFSLVNVNPASKLAVAAPAAVVAGSSFNFTLTAEDNLSHTDPFYSGTVTYSATGGGNTLPVNGTLTNGIATLPATLGSSGNQTITATDTVSNTITGTSATIYVQPTALGAGLEPVNTASVAQTVTFASPASALGASGIQVLTMGQVTTSDFVVATGGTCAAGTTQSGPTCTVKFTFKPSVPGLRRGAVVLYDGTNHPLATIYIFGAGTAGQAAFPGQVSTFASPGVGNIEGLATDGSNFYAPSKNNVYKITSGGAVSTLASGLWSGQTAVSAAIDGAGNLFVTTQANLYEFLNHNGTLSATADGSLTGSGYGFSNMQNRFGNVAVDGNGNVDIVDNANGRILQLAPGGGTPAVLASGLGDVGTLALDPNGNLYVTGDPLGHTLLRVPAGGGSATPLTPALANAPYSAAFDNAGNLYLTDVDGSNSLQEYSISGTVATATSLYALQGSSKFDTAIALDNSGNLFIANEATGNVVKVNLNTPPAFSFPATAVSQNSAAIATTLTNIGNASLVVASAALSGTNAADFTDSGNCTTAPTLAAGQSCAASIVWKPSAAQADTAADTVTDNDLNVSNSTQVINLTTATATKTTTTVTLPAPTSPTYGTAVTTTLTVNTPSGGTPAFPTPSGTIVWNLDGGANSSPQTLVGGQFTINAGILSAGSHTINVASYSGDGVYNAIASAAATATFTVAQVPLTAALIGPIAKTYDTSQTAPVTAANFSLTGLVNGDAYGVNLSVSDVSNNYDTVNAGTGKTVSANLLSLVAGSGADHSGDYLLSNPSLVQASVGVINQAPATLTASNQVFTLGAGSLPTLNYSITGFLGSDIQTSQTTGSPSLATSATTASPVGAYPITAAAGTLASTNYSFTYVNGTLSVLQLSQTLSGVVGGSAGAATVTFLAPSTETIGAIAVLTRGATGGDFSTTGGTCAAGSFTGGATCTVILAFSPHSAGLEPGAVVLYGAGSPAAPLQTILLDGAGAAALASFSPVERTLNATALASNPSGTATDGASVYVTQATSIARVDIATGTVTPGIITGTAAVAAARLDGAGNLYVFYGLSGLVNKFPRQSDGSFGAAVAIASGLTSSSYMTLDPAGNVFVVTNNDQDVFEYPASGAAPIHIANNSSGTIDGLGVDQAGNFYYSLNATPQRITAAAIATQAALPTAVATAANGAAGVYTFDAAGDLISTLGHTVVRFASTAGALASSPTTIATIAGSPIGVSVDASGNIYFADAANPELDQLNLQAAPTLAFSTTQADGVTSAAQSFPYTNIGNAPLTFGASGVALTTGTQFSLSGSICANNGNVAPAANCTISATFTPTSAGAQSDTLTLTSNAVNSPQMASLSGTGLATTLAINAGNHQSAHINAAFATALQVKATDANGPVIGLDVTFASPAGTFGSSATVATDGSGIATAPTYTANGTPALNYAVTASAPDAGNSVSFVETNVGNATHFAISTAPSTVVAGTANGVTATVQALDVDNQVDTTFSTDLLAITSNDPQAVLPAAAALTNGAGMFNLTFRTAGNRAATATDSTNPGTITAATSNPVTVTPAAATSLRLFVPQRADKGVAFNVQVTAVDPFNNKDVNYAGIVALTSADGAATLPAASALTSGTNSFSVTLNTGGPFTVSASGASPALPNATSGTILDFPFTSSVGAQFNGTSFPVTFPFNRSQTVASVVVTTQGATGADFTLDATAGNCVGSFTAGQSCTANIDFTPSAPGLRMGAVVLADSSHKLLQTFYLSGVGNGGLASFTGASSVTVSTGLGATVAVARDGAGNTFVATTTTVSEIPAGQSTATALTFTPASGITSLAVDGAGNLWVGEANEIQQIPLENGVLNPADATTALATTAVSHLAFDGNGNLYYSNPSTDDISRLAPTGAHGAIQSTLSFTSAPLAVDGAGNIYAADPTGASTGVLKFAANTFALSTVGSGSFAATGLAVDAAGDVFVAQGGAVVKIAAGTTAVTTVQPPGTAISGLTLDNAGNVYLLQGGAGALLKLDLADAPTLNFGASVPVNPVTPPSLSTTVSNVGSAALSFTSFTNSDTARFSATGSTCGSTVTSIAASSGTTCLVKEAFSPTSATTFNATATVGGSNLVIPLTGTGAVTTPTLTLTPNPGASVTYGTDVTIGVAVTSTQAQIPVSAAGTYTVDGGTALPVTITNGSATLDLGSALNVAGSPHAVVVTYTADSTFAAANQTQNITITQAPLTVTPNPASRAYGAANPAFSGTVAGVLNGDGISATYASGAGAATAAGAYATGANAIAATLVDPNGKLGNYNVTLNLGTLTITQAPLTVTPNPASRAYGAANPAFTVTISGFVNGDTSSVVTGAPALATTATATTGVGTAPITVDVTGMSAANYTFTGANGTLTITPATLSVVANDVSRAYGAANPVLPFTVSGFVNSDSTAVLSGVPTRATTATATSGVGAYPITITQGTFAAANYTFSFTPGTLTVTPASLTITADNQTRAYGAANPTLTFTTSGFANGEGTSVLSGAPSLSTAATTASAAGSYPVTASVGTLAAANYTFSFAPGTLTVTKAGLTVTADAETRVYGAANPAFTSTITGFLNGDTSSVVTGAPALATTATARTGVGTAPITVDVTGMSAANYTFTGANGTLTITPATITVSLLGPVNKGYDGTTMALPVGPASYVLAGAVNGDSISLVGAPATGTYTQAEAGSNIPFSVNLAGATLGGANAADYTLATTTATGGTGTIFQKALVVQAFDASRVYGSANPPLRGIFAGAVASDNLSASYATTTTAASPVGAYAIVPNVVDPQNRLSNYSVAITNGTLTVSPASLTVRANDASRAYGAANPAFGFTASGFVNNEGPTLLAGAPVLSTVAVPGNGVGTFPIVIQAGTLSAANYNLVFTNGTLTITQAALTVSANNVSRVYGAANPTLPFTVSGFLNGDSTGVLSGAPTRATSATAASAVGSYPITIVQGDFAASNYSFTFTPGTLTVTPATLTVTANNATRAFGAANPALTASLAGFVNNDASSVVSGAASLATTATATSNAGAYPITSSAGTLAATNYTFAFVPGTLTITQATQTITFPAIGFTVPGSVVALNATASSGLAVSYKVLSGAASVSGNQLTVLGAGNITVEADQAGNGNFLAALAATQTFSAGAPGVSLSANNLTFGSQTVQTASAAQTVTITNSGSAALHVASATTAAPFSATTTCATVAAGGTCSISVTFTPTATGNASGTLTIGDDASGAPQTVALIGSGIAPGIAITPGAIAFGGQPVGTSSNAQSLGILNTGSSPLTISSISVTDANGAASHDFSASGACATVAAGSSCSLNVTFTPGATGTRAARITLADNAGTQFVSVTGTGTAAGVSVAPSSLVFPPALVGATSFPLAVTITNTGTAPLTGLGSAVQGDFAMPSSTCGASLAAGASCAITVTSTPTLAGAESGSLLITDSLGTQPVALSSTGLAPGVNLSATQLVFGGELANTTSGAQTVTLSNSGTGALAFTSVAASTGFAQTSDCAGSLAAAASCSINAVFAPATTGAQTGIITVTDSAGTQTIALAGVGTSPGLALTPSLANFGAQPVGTAGQAQTLTLANTGTVALALNPRVATGDFVESDSCPATLNPGTSCQIGLSFAPTALGARTGSVVVADANGLASTLAALSGSGTLPGIVAAPGSVFFGSQQAGIPSAAQTVTVSNSGSAPLVISSVQTNGDFSQLNTCTSAALAPGANCVISVTMTPSTLGARTGSLYIYDNADGLRTVALSGMGQAAGATLAPSALAFGSAPIPAPGSAVTLTGTPQTVTLTNTGNAALTIASISVDGDFSQSNTCGASLAAAASCSINVSFSPTGLGHRTGTLVVSSNSASGTQVITLAGDGSPTGLTLSPSALNFGGAKVGAPSAPQTATLTNATGSVIASLAIVASGEFTETDNCGSSLANNASCAVNIVLTPLTQSAITGSISISGSLANIAVGTHTGRGAAAAGFGAATAPVNSGLAVVALSGSGNPAAIQLSASSLTFAAQAAGSASAPQTVTITNTGSSAALTTLTLVSTPDFPLSTTCTATLAAGANCTASVVFNPTAAGTRSGALTITADGGLSASVALSGQATGGILTVTPSSLAFGARPVGTLSAAQTVSISNTGTSALSLQSLAIGAGDFTLASTTCGTLPANLAAGASCTASVTFTPSRAAASSATLAITSNFGNALVALAGSGNSQGLALSATSFTFANQGVGLASTGQILTLTNNNASAVAITSIQATGDFATSGNCPASLAAAASCTARIVFTPTAVGPRAGTLAIVNSGATQSVALSGTGTNYAIGASGSSPLAQSVDAGGSATFQLLFTPGSFSGPVTLSCSGLPASASCGFAPQSLTLTANGAPVGVALTIGTRSRQGLVVPVHLPAAPPTVHLWFLLAGTLLLLLLATAVLAPRRKLAMGALVLGALAAAGCGGLNNLPNANDGTPPGTYAITVTATAGAATQTIQVKLTVL